MCSGHFIWSFHASLLKLVLFCCLLDLHTQVFLSVILIRSCHFNLKQVLSLKCLPFETFYWLLLNKQYKCLEILTLKTTKKTYFVQPWRAWVKLWYNDTRWRKLIFLGNTCQVKENVNLIIIYQFKKNLQVWLWLYNVIYQFLWVSYHDNHFVSNVLISRGWSCIYTLHILTAAKYINSVSSFRGVIALE